MRSNHRHKIRFQDIVYHDYQLSGQGATKFGPQVLTLKLVLSGATCLVSNGNNISSRASPTMKARQILKRQMTSARCLQHPWPEYSFPQIDFVIFRNINICVISAANLAYVERVLSEKLRIWLCLFFLLV